MFEPLDVIQSCLASRLQQQTVARYLGVVSSGVFPVMARGVGHLQNAVWPIAGLLKDLNDV